MRASLLQPLIRLPFFQCHIPRTTKRLLVPILKNGPNRSPKSPPVLCLRQLSSNVPPGNKQNDKKSKFRTRFIIFGGGFLAIHLSVLYAREYRKKERNEENSEAITFVDDPDYGRNKILRYKGYLYPFFVKDALKKMEKFPINDGDVIVASFPKSGTTWVQEIVYLIETDLDFVSAKGAIMEQRFPFLEFIYPGIDEIAKMPGRKLIKTHMPYTMLPETARSGKGKVIYIARNPKDVSVSNFYFTKMIKEVDFKKDFFTYFEKFLKDEVFYGPWWQHVLEYWQKKEDPNLLFLTYEELQENLPKGIQKIALFLGKDLTAGQVSLIAQHCGFEAMKSNPTTNYTWWKDLGIAKEGQEFMRKGKVGDWQNYYTKDMQQAVTRVCEDKLVPYGLMLQDRPS